jgi:beta-lactamase class C
MRIRALLSGLPLAVFALSAPVHASVKSLLQGAARELRHDGAPGVSLVAVVHGHTFYENSGSSDRPGLPLTNTTIFETASVSKVFTTTLLGIDVARGSKSLDERVAALFHRPLRSRLRPATLEMLATYTAGFPNLPAALDRVPSSEWGLENYSTDDFLRFVSRLQPHATVPAARVYSDASVGFLGLCLGHFRLKTFASRLDRNLFRPLGMRDTGIWLNARQERRLATGETPDGRAALRWPVDVMAGADGITSTTYDLGHFLAAELGERRGVSSAITRGMTIATNTGFLFVHDSRFQALAWTWLPAEIQGKPTWIIQKGGNLPGFSSRVAFNRELGIGVAILANRGSLPTQDVAMNLVRRIAEAR